MTLSDNTYSGQDWNALVLFGTVVILLPSHDILMPDDTLYDNRMNTKQDKKNCFLRPISMLYIRNIE